MLKHWLNIFVLSLYDIELPLVGFFRTSTVRTLSPFHVRNKGFQYVDKRVVVVDWLLHKKLYTLLLGTFLPSQIPLADY